MTMIIGGYLDLMDEQRTSAFDVSAVALPKRQQ